MLSTEKDARERWCPLVKYQNDSDDNGSNRWRGEREENLNPEVCRCIGGDCMMWRFADLEYEEGYCGLAGKPID